MNGDYRIESDIGIRIPCQRQVPCAAIAGMGNASTFTMACQKVKDHNGPHIVSFTVEGQWKVRVEVEEL